MLINAISIEGNDGDKFYNGKAGIDCLSGGNPAEIFQVSNEENNCGSRESRSPSLNRCPRSQNH